MKTILIIALLTLIGVTNAELILFPYPDTQLFPLGIYFGLAFATLFLFIYLWIDYRLNNSFHQFEWVLIALIVFPIIALLVGTPNIAVSTLNPALITNPSIFNPTPVKLLQSMFYGVSIPMIIYTLYFFPHKDVQINSIFNFIVFGAIFFVLVEIAYSLVVEWSEYVILLEGYDNGSEITSFTSNPNVFAFNLSMGLYGAVMLFVKENNFKIGYFIMIIFFYTFIIITIRRLVFLSTTLFVIPLLLLSFLSLFKKKFKYILITISSFFLIVGLFLIYGLGRINLPFSELLETFTNPNAALSTIERLDIWVTGLSLFTTSNQLTGYGFGLSNVYLALALALPIDEVGGYVTFYDRFHNGFLEILVSYGLIGTLLLTIAHWEYFKALIQFTKRYWIAIPMWALIISFAVQMMFEDRILFRPDLSGVFFMTILILPLVKPEAFSKR